MEERVMDKHIWEGWTVGDFIESLQPQLDMIQQGRSWKSPMTTQKELKDWCKTNQPYYKKNIPQVVNYFCRRYGIN